MTISSDSYNALLNMYTPLGAAAPIHTRGIFWIVLSVLSLLLTLWVYRSENSREHHHLQLDVNNYSLSPASIAYFSHGVRQVEYALTATFLDWIRKGRIENTILEKDGIQLTGTIGPLLPDEEFLMKFLSQYEMDGIISFRRIRNARKDDSQAFYEEMQEWFEIIDQSLKAQGFLQMDGASKKQYPLFIVVGFILLITGFFGISLKMWIAILLCMSGISLILMGVKGYGAYPEKGEALKKTIESIEANHDSNIFPVTSTLIYSYGMGHKNEDLIAATAREYGVSKERVETYLKDHLNKVKETFLSGISMNLF